ncbi:MAG TPA: phospholipid scramblase-related protein [Candidatus Omnitrophota bacterium]|nr:phospholipid scramblase-related protein [Candidatus Omnitrophota bacterium]HPS36931.1 phospholipid scramblase-related protein [Candidatus Omnitrophota bacterium]
MEMLKGLDSLTLREKIAYTIPENWKFKPVLCLAGISEQELYYVVSEKPLAGGAVALKGARSFTLYLLDGQGQEILYFEKRSGFFASRVEIFDGAENLLGAVQKHGTPSRPHFLVSDAGGKILCGIEETAGGGDAFTISRNSVSVGTISRKWISPVPENGPKNDHFGIVFPFESDVSERSVLLGALLFIDFL